MMFVTTIPNSLILAAPAAVNVLHMVHAVQMHFYPTAVVPVSANSMQIKYGPAKAPPLVSQLCHHGSVQLVGGVTNSTGRLEFCAHGVWGKVCNYLRYWSPENTKVACRQLGFSEKSKVCISQHATNSNYQCFLCYRCICT